MKIGELARRTGLTASRIRFYESLGLLPMVDRMANGCRRYPRDAQQVLELIDTAQRAGFSLDEIRTLLPANLENRDHAALVRTLRRKLTDIGELQARLVKSKAQLQELLSDIENKPEDITCADNAKRVLSRMLVGSQENDTPGPPDHRAEGLASSAPTIFSAVSLAENGFCPVINRPSTRA